MPHRDLPSRTFDFACRIVHICRQLSETPGVRRQIAGQLLRAGTSVGANVEEAKAAYSKREFACKYALVLREAREVLGERVEREAGVGALMQIAQQRGPQR